MTHGHVPAIQGSMSKLLTVRMRHTTQLSLLGGFMPSVNVLQERHFTQAFILLY